MQTHAWFSKCSMFLVALSAVLGTTLTANAAVTSPDSRKFSARFLFRQPNASEAASIVSAGAIKLADYGSFSLFSAPSSLINTVSAAASRLGITITVHDIFDKIFAPGGVIVRSVLPSDFHGLGSASYLSGQNGL